MKRSPERIAARIAGLEPGPTETKNQFDEHDSAFCKALLVYREQLDPGHIAIARACLAVHGTPLDIAEIEERRQREHVAEQRW